MAQPGGEPWWVVAIHSRGFSGYEPIQAATKPGVNPYSSYAAGPFATKAQAQAWIAKHQTHGHIPSVPDPFAALGLLFERETWVRVAKVAIGMALIVIGVLHLTGAEKIAVDIAGAAGKGAVAAL